MFERRLSKFRPAIERLEDRWTPAGNVTASVQNILVGTAFVPTLVVKGDVLANTIDVSQNSFENFTVTGFGTTVNGGASFTAGGIQAISVNTGGGGDVVFLGLNGLEIDVIGNLSVNTGSGNGFVQDVLPAGTFLRVFKNLSVASGAGNDVYIFGDVTVVGAATFTHIAGGNTTLLIQAGTAVNGSLGSLTVNNGIGDDFTLVTGTNVTGSVSIANGNAAFSATGAATTTTFSAGNSGATLSIGGNLTISNGTSSGTGQPFTTTVEDYNVNGNVAINTGNASNPAAGGSTVSLSDNNTLGATQVKGSVSIGGTGIGFKTVNIGDQTGASSLDIGKGLSINLSTATGGSTLNLNDVSIHGATAITGTSGADTLNIQTIAAGANGTNFFGNVSVNLAGGNDTLNLSGGGGFFVTFFTPAGGSIVFNGGGGVNTRNIMGAIGTDVVFFAVVPQFVNFL